MVFTSSLKPIQTIRASCCIVLLQDECQRRVRKLVTEETGKTLKVQAGWYTERQMKDTLKMPRLDFAYMLYNLNHNIRSISNTEETQIVNHRQLSQVGDRVSCEVHIDPTKASKALFVSTDRIPNQ